MSQIFDLQNLDAKFIAKQEPMSLFGNNNLQNLAWLGKDGQVHSVANLQNLNRPQMLGATAPVGLDL